MDKLSMRIKGFEKLIHKEKRPRRREMKATKKTSKHNLGIE